MHTYCDILGEFSVHRYCLLAINLAGALHVNNYTNDYTLLYFAMVWF